MGEGRQKKETGETGGERKMRREGRWIDGGEQSP